MLLGEHNMSKMCPCGMDELITPRTSANGVSLSASTIRAGTRNFWHDDEDAPEHIPCLRAIFERFENGDYANWAVFAEDIEVPHATLL